MKNLEKLSLADLRALVDILKEKEGLYTFARNTEKAKEIILCLQVVEDQIDACLLEFGINV